MASVPRIPVSVGFLTTVLYVGFIGIPFVALFVKAGMESNLIDAILDKTVYTAIRLSLVTSIIAVIVVLLIGTPFAYFIARVNFRGKYLVSALIELPIILPPVVSGVAMLMAFGRNGLIGSWLDEIGINIPFTMTAVIFAQLFVSAPFYIRAARSGFESVDIAFEQLSLTSGKSPMDTFRLVSLPLAFPSLVGGIVLAWARAISEFGATIMFAGNFIGQTQTMPLAIMSTMETDLSRSLILAVVLVAMSLIVLIGLSFLTRSRMVGGE